MVGIFFLLSVDTVMRSLDEEATVSQTTCDP